MRCLSVFMAVAVIVSAAGVAHAAEKNPEAALMADLEKISSMIDLGEDSCDETALARAKAKIAANPGEAFDILAKALKENTHDEDFGMHSACLWGLGQTKDPRAVDVIIADLDKVHSTIGYKALAQIGNEAAVKYLMHVAETMPAQTGEGPGVKYPMQTTVDMPDSTVVIPDFKFIAMDLLAGKKHVPVTTLTKEMFERAMPGPQMQQIQLQLIFGKLGDAGIPFLLEKLADPNKTARANAVFLLGMWLCAPEAGKPLKDRFFVEPDPEVRDFIIFSLERVMPLAEIDAFLKQAKDSEKDENVATTISEAIEMLEQIKKEAAEKEAPPKPDREAFKKAVQAYRDDRNLQTEALAKASAVEFEPELKALREEMLGVEPMDDAVMSYFEITAIMVNNRMRAESSRAPEGK